MKMGKSEERRKGEERRRDRAIRERGERTASGVREESKRRGGKEKKIE